MRGRHGRDPGGLKACGPVEKPSRALPSRPRRCPEGSRWRRGGASPPRRKSTADNGRPLRRQWPPARSPVGETRALRQPAPAVGGALGRRGKAGPSAGRAHVEAAGHHSVTSGYVVWSPRSGWAAAPRLGAATHAAAAVAQPPCTCSPVRRPAGGGRPGHSPRRARRRRPSGYRRQGAATWRRERRLFRLHNNSGSGNRFALPSAPCAAYLRRAALRSAAPAPPAPRRGGVLGWAAFS